MSSYGHRNEGDPKPLPYSTGTACLDDDPGKDGIFFPVSDILLEPYYYPGTLYNSTCKGGDANVGAFPGVPILIGELEGDSPAHHEVACFAGHGSNIRRPAFWGNLFRCLLPALHPGLFGLCIMLLAFAMSSTAEGVASALHVHENGPIPMCKM